MPSESVDQGLLTPVAVGHDGLVSDRAVLDALVAAELGLVRAWAAVEALPESVADEIAAAWGWDAVAGRASAPGLDVAGRAAGLDVAGLDAAVLDAAVLEAAGLDVAGLAEEAVAGGNPVIPLVPRLKQLVPPAHREWVHRGATSQDIVDTALMLVARRAVGSILTELTAAQTALAAFAVEHRDVVAAGRTLATHAVPTTVGARAAVWLRSLQRAGDRLQRLELPAQLGGAAGTRASFLELGGPDAAALPARFAESLGLDDTVEVWHTARWPVTELADVLVQTTDALSTLAGDVITLARTEIGELSFGSGGGSSAMPQKSNPVDAVLIRSAGLRAPQLAATLHLCAALADDERPAGAWHAEWPTLRELLRLALGASAHAARLTAALRVDREAVARTLALSGGLILAERLSIVLTPRIGADRFAALVAVAAAGADLAELLGALPEAAALDIPALLDPAGYTGEAAQAVDRSVAGIAPTAGSAGTVGEEPS